MHRACDKKIRRVNCTAKVHVVDSGLAAAHLLGISQRKLSARDPSALTEVGHVAETFVVNELIKQAGWAKARVE